MIPIIYRLHRGQAILVCGGIAAVLRLSDAVEWCSESLSEGESDTCARVFLQEWRSDPSPEGLTGEGVAALLTACLDEFACDERTGACLLA